MDDKTKLEMIKKFASSSLEFHETADEHAAVLSCILDVIDFEEEGEDEYLLRYKENCKRKRKNY